MNTWNEGLTIIAHQARETETRIRLQSYIEQERIKMQYQEEFRRLELRRLYNKLKKALQTEVSTTKPNIDSTSFTSQSTKESTVKVPVDDGRRVEIDFCNGRIKYIDYKIKPDSYTTETTSTNQRVYKR